MVRLSEVFDQIPSRLRESLLAEYLEIVENYAERRWRPSELAGGRFCEVVYSIIEGYGSGIYPTEVVKPRNFLEACRRLEARDNVPRSFQILIPRLLPGLYEIRNNRNVGHVGGDVDPSYMDATAVVSLTSWILAELARVFHNVSTEAAQSLVDQLAERRSPLVWVSGSVRRVLDSRMRLREQILVLTASATPPVATADLTSWTESKNRGYFFRVLRELHKLRLIDLNELESHVVLLPPGVEAAAEAARKAFGAPNK